ncbi:MAG TPA: hypothetical protein VH764_08490 [Gemmatimonadales bacterium]|jgi:hypothetical protein
MRSALPRLAGPSLLVALASLACAPGSAPAGPAPKVWARSHNASEVDIYMLCGNQRARWVGVVPAKGAAAFDVAGDDTFCPWGVNFFLVVRDQGRGYWAGPIRPGTGDAIELVIEKYAGLSMARLMSD